MADSQIDQLELSQKKQKKSDKVIFDGEDDPEPSDQKTCCQSFKQKLSVCLLATLNFLQCERLFTEEEINNEQNRKYSFSKQDSDRSQVSKTRENTSQISKNGYSETEYSGQLPLSNYGRNMDDQEVVVRKRYLEDYSESYSERKKHFGYTFDMVQRQREKQMEEKNKNFWAEFKRFICCQGGNEMEEIDDIPTNLSNYNKKKANMTGDFNDLRNKKEKENVFVFDLGEDDQKMEVEVFMELDEKQKMGNLAPRRRTKAKKKKNDELMMNQQFKEPQINSNRQNEKIEQKIYQKGGEEGKKSGSMGKIMKVNILPNGQKEKVEFEDESFSSRKHQQGENEQKNDMQKKKKLMGRKRNKALFENLQDQGQVIQDKEVIRLGEQQTIENQKEKKQVGKKESENQELQIVINEEMLADQEQTPDYNKTQTIVLNNPQAKKSKKVKKLKESPAREDQIEEIVEDEQNNQEQYKEGNYTTEFTSMKKKKNRKRYTVKEGEATESMNLEDGEKIVEMQKKRKRKVVNRQIKENENEEVIDLDFDFE